MPQEMESPYIQANSWKQGEPCYMKAQHPRILGSAMQLDMGHIYRVMAIGKAMPPSILCRSVPKIDAVVLMA